MKRAKFAFLRIDSDSLEEALRFPSITAARQHFARIARNLGRFGQTVSATIHLSDDRTGADLEEYPDYALSVGERGGIVCESA